MKSKIIFFVFACFVSTVLLGCRGTRTSVGIVRDALSGDAIRDVACAANGGNLVFTDSLGRYSVHGPNGSCIFSCKDLKVVFSKSGYKTLTLVNPPNDNVFLSKE